MNVMLSVDVRLLLAVITRLYEKRCVLLTSIGYCLMHRPHSADRYFCENVCKLSFFAILLYLLPVLLLLYAHLLILVLFVCRTANPTLVSQDAAGSHAALKPY